MLRVVCRARHATRVAGTALVIIGPTFLMWKIRQTARPTAPQNAETRRLIVTFLRTVRVARPASRAVGMDRVAEGKRISPAPGIAEPRLAGSQGLTVPGNAAFARRVHRVAGMGPVMRIR